jgi:hypothetical protein
MVRILLLAGAAAPPSHNRPPGGFPLPDVGAYASLQAALAELERSADTIVAEVGPAT